MPGPMTRDTEAATRDCQSDPYPTTDRWHRVHRPGDPACPYIVCKCPPEAEVGYPPMGTAAAFRVALADALHKRVCERKYEAPNHEPGHDGYDCDPSGLLDALR